MPVNRHGKSMAYDTTSSQRRAARVLGLALDDRAARHTAIEILESAGAPGNGVPSGYTSVEARKLTDDELAERLRPFTDEQAAERGRW